MSAPVHSWPLGEKRTCELMALSAFYCLEEGGSHGPDHSERVHDLALRIGRAMHARLEVLSPAAIMHDVGRRYETESCGRVCHAVKGAEIASRHLPLFGITGADLDAVLHCIRSHRYRGEERPSSLEAEILHDADKLDSIGAVGIGRAFLFAGKIGARLHNGTIAVETTRSYSTEDTAYREFQVKMCRVRDRMLTPMGRELAEERHRFMDVFFARLNMEIYGQAAPDAAGELGP